MKSKSETIAAVATAPGRGGIGVVRVSGPASGSIAESILGHCPRPRYAEYRPFVDVAGEAIDQGLALFFKGPNSFTGEDVLELQGHGGPVVLDRLLKRTLALGARAARPGEFSERAFINGKLDLAQAEAIADLIEASSEQAAQSAMRSLQGDFSNQIDALVEALLQLRIYVEAAIDFPEEEIDFLSDGRVEKDLNQLVAKLASIRSTAKQGFLLREGMTLVLAGQPNVGKSSLLNRLAQRDAAIVTDVPGTTRDLLREQIHIDGMPLHIIDTAGLRESTDPIEQEGMRRAWSAIESADRILLLIDDNMGFGSNDQAILDRLPPKLPVTVVHNKIDTSGKAPGLGKDAAGPAIALSAKSGEGLELLVQHLESSMGFQQTEEGTFMARRRHLEALDAAAATLESAQNVLAHGAGELLAEELRISQNSLGEITGKISSEDLLGRIFSSFCIGK